MNTKELKQQQLNKLYEPYKACMMCPLGSLGRTTIVFGQGNPDARLMIIGEGPGKQEDEQGIPFIGRSGKILNETLKEVGIKRENIFITNIVKCRPPNNRAPSKLESTTCKNLLLIKQIEIINPTIICSLGASALSALINKPIKMKEIRGQIICYKTLKIIPTFHPAYILRNRKESSTFLADFAYIKSLV